MNSVPNQNRLPNLVLPRSMSIPFLTYELEDPRMAPRDTTGLSSISPVALPPDSTSYPLRSDVATLQADSVPTTYIQGTPSCDSVFFTEKGNELIQQPDLGTAPQVLLNGSPFNYPKSLEAPDENISSPQSSRNAKSRSTPMTKSISRRSAKRVTSDGDKSEVARPIPILDSPIELLKKRKNTATANIGLTMPQDSRNLYNDSGVGSTIPFTGSTPTFNGSFGPHAPVSVGMQNLTHLPTTMSQPFGHFPEQSGSNSQASSFNANAMSANGYYDSFNTNTLSANGQYNSFNTNVQSFTPAQPTGVFQNSQQFDLPSEAQLWHSSAAVPPFSSESQLTATAPSSPEYVEIEENPNFPLVDWQFNSERDIYLSRPRSYLNGKSILMQLMEQSILHNGELLPLEKHKDTLKAEIEQLKSECNKLKRKSHLAQAQAVSKFQRETIDLRRENARLTKEATELHARLDELEAAPVRAKRLEAYKTAVSEQPPDNRTPEQFAADIAMGRPRRPWQNTEIGRRTREVFKTLTTTPEEKVCHSASSFVSTDVSVQGSSSVQPRSTIEISDDSEPLPKRRRFTKSMESNESSSPSLRVSRKKKNTNKVPPVAADVEDHTDDWIAECAPEIEALLNKDDKEVLTEELSQQSLATEHHGVE